MSCVTRSRSSSTRTAVWPGLSRAALRQPDDPRPEGPRRGEGGCDSEEAAGREATTAQFKQLVHVCRMYRRTSSLVTGGVLVATGETKKEGLITRAVDWVFGYDFFISYSHGDGPKLPLRLKERL